MTSSEYTVRIWINVTTSANWTRPAVGIIRVERALAEHLQSHFGKDRCRLCVWKDDRFVEWAEDHDALSADHDKALDVMLPRGPSFELSRLFIGRALARFAGNDEKADQSGTMNLKIPLREQDIPRPIAGDILISVGLDWDNQYSSRFFSIARQQGIRIITCCYDLIPVLFPQYCVGDVAKRFAEYFMDLTWGSEAVLCISEQTRRDYLNLCTDLVAPARKTVVIPLGDNLPVGSSYISASVLRLTESPFILYVSTIERRKNHEILYRAYHLLARRGLAKELPVLVFVGMPGWGIGDFLKDIELDPLTAGLIVQLNHVTDGELEYLYKKARFCVYPSLYEGWGLPVGEALSMGKAIISSAEASLPEVGGDLVRYVPAWDPYSWADAIYEYVKKPELVTEAERRVKSRYVPRKWTATAAVVASLVEEMILEDAAVVKQRELSPGHDLNTECGIHWGPSIRTNGADGVLLCGPYISMRSGKYQMQMIGSLLSGHVGQFTVQVTSDRNKVTHFSKRYDLSLENEGVLADCEFELPQFTQEFEIRCIVESRCAMQLDMIRLSPREHK